MFKELVKKSLLLKRLVKKYRSHKNQPSWRPLLNQDKHFWNSALNNAKKGQKILIATSVGSHLPGTTMESMLAVALTLRGADAHIFLCDAVLPACLACWSDIYPNHKKFAKYGPSKECADCFSPAYKMYKSLGITIHRYSDFLSTGDIKQASQISLSVPYHGIGNFVMDDIAAGEHALAGALRFFACGTLDGEPYGEPILRRYLIASILTTSATLNLLKRHDFATAVFHHGIYVPQGLIGEVCRKKGIHVVNWNPAYRKKCFIFSHHDTYHHTMTAEPAEKWMNIPWNENIEKELLDYLKSRWYGTDDWIWFHGKPEFELKKIASSIGIDFNKPCIGLLTSVMWDAVLHYPSNAFPNMLEWLKCTIDYFIIRPDLQLVIRVHPAEVRGALPSRQCIVEEIKKLYPELPNNIIIIPPESNISTYTVMMQCDSVIIYNTKTGIELAAMGLPIIVAGEAWIRNKGFAFDVDNPKKYLKLLDRLPLQRRMSDKDTLMAKKYAYHFFFRRMIPLECIEPAKGNPPYKIKPIKLRDLMSGQSAGLDLICNGILDGSDFIYPSK